MGRKKRHEDHINHEAWAIPYGDLVTLLLAFFVVMYSISSVNEGKYRVLSDSMVAAFRGTPKTTRPIQIGDATPVGGAQQAFSDVVPLRTVGRSALELPEETPAEELADIESVQEEIARASLKSIAAQVRSALEELIELGQVQIRETPLGLEVEIRTDLLFSVGVARVEAGALPTLQRLADILQPMPNPIQVEGHTDDVPISTARFPSNWELSSARASSVIRLFQGRGVAPERMVAVGLGEFRPAQDNATSVGRDRNRRVTIIILANDEMPGSIVGQMGGGGGRS